MAGFYFLAYFICTSCLVAGQPIYVLKGTGGHLRPVLPGQPNALLWTHNGNIVVEFDGSEQQVYSPYEDRITLDWHSAELNIHDLRFRDSGVYELEVDINNHLHASKYELAVIDKVPMPKVSCEMNKDSTSDTPDIKATLLCSAESRTPESLMKFEWRSGKQEKLQSGPKLEIPLGDKDNEEKYSCFVSNPLSSEEATFTAKECYNAEGSSGALAVCISVILLLVIAVVGSIWYCRRRKKACFQSNDPEKQSPTADTESDKNTAQDREKEPLLGDNETPPSPRPGNVREKIKKIENMEKINKMNDPDERAPPERNRGSERGRGVNGNPGFTLTKVEQPPQQDPNHHDADKPEETAKSEVLPSESSDLQKFNRPDLDGEPDESDEDKHTNLVSTALSPGGEQPPQPDPNRHDADKPEETPTITVLSSDSSDPKETKETDPAGSESDIDERKKTPTTPSLGSTSSLDQSHHADIIKAGGDLDQEKGPQKEEDQDQKGLDKDTAQSDGDKSSLEAVSPVSSPGPADCLPSDDNTTLNDNTGPRKEEEISKEEQNEEAEADQVLRGTVSGSDSSGSWQNEDESSKSSEEETSSTPDQKDQDMGIRDCVKDNESGDKIPSPAESQNLDSTKETEEPENNGSSEKSPETPQMNPNQEKENQSKQDLNESEGQTSEAGTVAGQSINVLKGTGGHLRPDLPGQPNTILWKHNGNKVVEFDGSEQQVYSPYEDRITLDWHSAELDIHDLRFTDSGVYELEVDINNRLHASQYELAVIDKVPMPKVSCEMNKDSTSDTPDIKAMLLCSAESSTPESLIKFEWRSGKQEKLQLGPKLEIPLGDKDDEEKYSCSVSNPVSSEKATFTAKECYNGQDSTVVLAVCISVILLLLIAVAVVVILFRRKKACFASKQSNDPEKQSPAADTGSDGYKAQHEEERPLIEDSATSSLPRPGHVRGEVKRIDKLTVPGYRAPTEKNTGPERGRSVHGNPGSPPTKVEQPPQPDPNCHDADKPEETPMITVLSSDSSDPKETKETDPAGSESDIDERKKTPTTPSLGSTSSLDQSHHADITKAGGDLDQEKGPKKEEDQDQKGLDKDTAQDDGDKPSFEAVSPVSSPGPADCLPSNDDLTRNDPAEPCKEEENSKEGSENVIDEPKEPPTTPSLGSTSSLDRSNHADITGADGDLDQEKEPQKKEEDLVQKGLDKETAQGDGDKPSLEAVSSVSSPGPADCLPSDDNTTLNNNTGPRKEEENSKEEGDRDEHKNPESATTEVEPLHQQYPNHHDADKPEENAEIKVSTSNSPDSEETTEPDPADELDKSVEDEHKNLSTVSTAPSPGGEQLHQQDTNYHDVNKPEETPAIKVPPSDSSDPNVIPSDESVEDERSALRSPGYVKDEVKRIDKITVPGEQAPPERNTGNFSSWKG
ncbi:clumping factor A-like isoform X2 [Xyrichtys novacula]|uniref:Clumping factor A-like isoform X2 n=1 Tax=Xyrichtys novacula TaxID=13765 RepID=A0AAV1H0G4_XYRNO|nr:clumping factor A-like isoform X2 [Xyrichtys novacula]